MDHMEASAAASPCKGSRHSESEGLRCVSVNSSATTLVPATASPETCSGAASPSSPDRSISPEHEVRGLSVQLSPLHAEGLIGRQVTTASGHQLSKSNMDLKFVANSELLAGTLNRQVTLFDDDVSRGPASKAVSDQASTRASARRSTAGPPRPAELRRSKYTVPKVRLAPPSGCAGRSARGPSAAARLAPGGYSPIRNAAACDAEMVWDTVLIEGPMQQRILLAFWIWRWCVLVRVHGRWELRTYQDEAASLSAPGQPLQRLVVANLAVGLNALQPTVLTLSDKASNELRLMLRTGRGQRWEELASSVLWTKALRSARAPTSYV